MSELLNDCTIWTNETPKEKAKKELHESDVWFWRNPGSRPLQDKQLYGLLLTILQTI